MGIFSKKNSGGGNGDQPSQFRVRDAQRIAKAVHAYETERKGRNPSSLPRAVGGGGGGGGAIRRATFSGVWLVGTEKVVTFADNTAQTASIANFLFNIPHGSTRDALVTEEFLVAVRC